MTLDLPSEAALAEECSGQTTSFRATILCRSPRPFPLHAGITAAGIADLGSILRPR